MKTCAFCHKPFEAAFAQRVYCSVSCRNKNRRANPEYRALERVRQRDWQRRNLEKLRVYSREFYPAYAQRKMNHVPWSTLFPGAKQRAKKKGLSFDLTDSWAAARWTGCCELTGVSFSPPEKRVARFGALSPSIDRIDPTKGYTQGNCRFILWAINRLKMGDSDALVFSLAKALIQPSPPVVEAALSLPA